MKINKNAIIVIAALIASVFMGYAFKDDHKNDIKEFYKLVDTTESMFEQEVKQINKDASEITKLYRGDKLLGVIHDKSRLESLFQEVYKEEYEKEFPDSKLGFMDDLFQVNELSYNLYDDRDADIFEYIKNEKLFAIEVNKVEFSNGAIIYVKNMEDFNNAREKFILNFISESSYNSLKNNQKIPPLLVYGTRDVGVEVFPERLEISKGLASKEEILFDETSILTFLSYGYDPELESYEVLEYDAVAGVGSHFGMSANQIVSINSEVIKSENQVLAVGTELNVTKFNSPFNVSIKRERMVSEQVYPKEAVYKSDPTLKKGVQIVDVEEKVGYADVVYLETYINGESVDSEKIKSKIIIEPVQGEVRYGTFVEPKVGSGSMRWPMDNAMISCGWYCYGGHQALDIQARGVKYGPILASDRGVIEVNTYNSMSGYYVLINHNNGLKTRYGHMRSPGYFPVGATVKKGEVIGYVGMTGLTTGPHVHFEVWRGGTKVNPCGFIGC